MQTAERHYATWDRHRRERLGDMIAVPLLADVSIKDVSLPLCRSSVKEPRRATMLRGTGPGAIRVGRPPAGPAALGSERGSHLVTEPVRPDSIRARKPMISRDIRPTGSSPPLISTCGPTPFQPRLFEVPRSCDTGKSEVIQCSGEFRCKRNVRQAGPSFADRHSLLRASSPLLGAFSSGSNRDN